MGVSLLLQSPIKECFTHLFTYWNWRFHSDYSFHQLTMIIYLPLQSSQKGFTVLAIYWVKTKAFKFFLTNLTEVETILNKEHEYARDILSPTSLNIGETIVSIVTWSMGENCTHQIPRLCPLITPISDKSFALHSWKQKCRNQSLSQL